MSRPTKAFTTQLIGLLLLALALAQVRGRLSDAQEAQYLKEIERRQLLHAEAYPAGELKHGPLALVTSAMPVVTVAPNDALLEKL